MMIRVTVRLFLASAALIAALNAVAQADEPRLVTSEPVETKPAEIEPAESEPTKPATSETEPVKKASDAPEELSLEELLNTKVTTVSRQASTVGQSPAAIFVITPEMIRRSGATTIPELLRMVPGMDVARVDNNKWNISVRGFNGDRFQGKLLVQIDGRTLYNPIFSGVYWDTVDYPLEDIERIEVIRGPGASVWGANAVNGIINIITKSAKDTQGALLVAGAGNEERGFGTLRYGGKSSNESGDKTSGGMHYRVYAKGFNRDEQFTAANDSHDQWRGGNAGLRADWQTGKRDAITLDAGYLRSDAGRHDFRPMTAAPFTFDNLEDETTDAEHFLARWSRTLSKDANWTLQAYWDRVHRRSSNNLLNLQWDTFDVDFQHQFAGGANQTIVYGLGYRLVDASLGGSSRDNGFILSYFQPNRQLHTLSAFVQDQIALRKNNLALTLGSKFEHNSFTGFEVQPTGRLLWTPSSRRSAWAAVSRAVRTPNLLEDFTRFTQAPTFPAELGGAPRFPRLTGNPDFESEELLAYELGYRTQATANISLDAALFYNDYSSLKVLVPGAPTIDLATGANILPLPAQNRMSGKVYGVEVGTTWQPRKSWRLQGAYSFLNMNLRPDPSLPAGTIAGARAEEGKSPRHQVYMRSSWDLPRHLEFDLIGRGVSSVKGFNLS
ncbi:MAG: TonB-dependent receptor plug domain-containing protein, partial [Armatimonadota bacterium]|nr:TonB-dependent receptor plug domain-containing protein [Armatimonadota bacterium]